VFSRTEKEPSSKAGKRTSNCISMSFPVTKPMPESYKKFQKHIHVACAIIEQDSFVLAVQRGPFMSMPLKWEFPGGKIDHNESPEECVRRELVEELGLQIKVNKHMPPATHRYSAFTVTLYPFICSIETGEIVLYEHCAAVWLPAEELLILDWAEADIPVINEYCNYLGRRKM
jgi:8-oxo-dGTP diphosphatase